MLDRIAWSVLYKVEGFLKWNSSAVTKTYCIFLNLDLPLPCAHGLGARGTDSNMKLMLDAVLE